eukprot:TRINITY_DN5094_c0_g1_i7.p1 TRINITY_DN5094_c0_g1~~TRINITY_DN5094_c0_g1_i7.p1  ORF type:complete len:116 (+),score=25.06 TRINITY_DN5094_c0_g1_i7:1-348(+)
MAIYPDDHHKKLHPGFVLNQQTKYWLDLIEVPHQKFSDYFFVDLTKMAEEPKSGRVQYIPKDNRPPKPSGLNREEINLDDDIIEEEKLDDGKPGEEPKPDVADEFVVKEDELPFV